MQYIGLCNIIFSSQCSSILRIYEIVFMLTKLTREKKESEECILYQ